MQLRKRIQAVFLLGVFSLVFLHDLLPHGHHEHAHDHDHAAIIAEHDHGHHHAHTHDIPASSEHEDNLPGLHFLINGHSYSGHSHAAVILTHHPSSKKKEISYPEVKPVTGNYDLAWFPHLTISAAPDRRFYSDPLPPNYGLRAPPICG